jgi:hypothetical protein
MDFKLHRCGQALQRDFQRGFLVCLAQQRLVEPFTRFGLAAGKVSFTRVGRGVR